MSIWNKNKPYLAPSRCRQRTFHNALSMTVFALICAHITHALPSPRGMTLAEYKQTLREADKGQNAQKLMFGYFARRNLNAVPTDKGFELLEAAVNAEPEASRRWFVLERVRGFAGIRLSDDGAYASFAAYEDIFSHATEADHVGAGDTYVSSVYEFVSTVNGQHAMGVYGGPPAKRELLSAVNSYVDYMSASKRAAELSATKIPWAEAFAAADLKDDADSIASSILSDEKLCQVPVVYATAIDLYGIGHPREAIALLQKIKHTPGKSQAVEIWKRAEAIAERSRDYDTALAAQNHVVTATNRGRNEIVRLLNEAGRIAQMTAFVNRLKAHDLSDEEVVDVAGALAAIRGAAASNDAAAQAVRLLESYLNGGKPRDTVQELRARLLCASLLRAANDPVAASKVLNAGSKLPLPKDSYGAFLYRQLHRELSVTATDVAEFKGNKALLRSK